MRKDYVERPQKSPGRLVTALKWLSIVFLALILCFGIVKVAKSRTDVKGCLKMQQMETSFAEYEVSNRDVEFCQRLNIKIK